MDVADRHRAALAHLEDGPGLRVFNLGTGVGTSVLGLLRAFESVTAVPIPYDMVAGRAGDVAELVADPSRVEKAWGWRARRDAEQMCRDAWRFQQSNPDGYGS